MPKFITLTLMESNALVRVNVEQIQYFTIGSWRSGTDRLPATILSMAGGATLYVQAWPEEVMDLLGTDSQEQEAPVSSPRRRR